MRLLSSFPCTAGHHLLALLDACATHRPVPCACPFELGSLPAQRPWPRLLHSACAPPPWLWLRCRRFSYSQRRLRLESDGFAYHKSGILRPSRRSVSSCTHATAGSATTIHATVESACGRTSGCSVRSHRTRVLGPGASRAERSWHVGGPSGETPGDEARGAPVAAEDDFGVEAHTGALVRCVVREDEDGALLRSHAPQHVVVRVAPAAAVDGPEELRLAALALRYVLKVQ